MTKDAINDEKPLGKNQRVQDEEALRLSLAVEYSDELVNMASLDGQMTFLNPAGQAMLGIDSDQVVHTNIMEVIPDHLVSLVEKELLPTLMSGGTWKGELQYRNLKTGELEDVFATTYTVPDPTTGHPLFLANVSRSISEIKRAEKEKERLQLQLQSTQKLESLGVLAGGIAHDFNNLLTGILGNAELAQMETAHNPRIQHYLKMILTSSKQAAELCKQMLAYSGKGLFVTSVINPCQVIDELEQILKASISKKVALNVEIMENTAPIEADPSQLQQILLNLVINASEAIENKVGTIFVRMGTRHYKKRDFRTAYITKNIQEGDYTFIEVEDSGHGMSQETISKIFDPFYSTKFTGRGLGLSAVLGILRSHKGTIKVASTLGKGSRFTLLFPAVSPRPTEIQPTFTPSAIWQGNGTVLLIDDEDVVRRTVAAMLQSVGFQVVAAEDGLEGLSALEQHRDSIVLIMLDLTMPRMSAEETYSKLKAIRNDVPIIVCSGYNETELIRRFSYTSEVDSFLQKPFLLEDLIAKVSKLVDSS